MRKMTKITVFLAILITSFNGYASNFDGELRVGSLNVNVTGDIDTNAGTISVDPFLLQSVILPIHKVNYFHLEVTIDRLLIKEGIC